MSWVYVPGLEASNSESGSPCQERAASLTWRGKPMPPLVLSREWTAGNFIRRLSGLTLPPSTLEDGVASWIASLAATRVSQIRSQGSAKVRLTTDFCSTKSSGSCRSAGLVVSSARTCRGTRTDNLGCSSPNWSDWATALRQEYSARPKWARATAENDSSSWPSARATDGSKGGPNQRGSSGDMMLPSAAAQWETPSVAVTAGSRLTRGGARSDEMLLTGQALAFSPPALPTRNGPQSSQPSRALNPRFVEWLMGWPTGWTDFAQQETAWCHWLRLSRGALSKLVSPPHTEAQQDLFG